MREGVCACGVYVLCVIDLLSGCEIKNADRSFREAQSLAIRQNSRPLFILTAFTAKCLFSFE